MRHPQLFQLTLNTLEGRVFPSVASNIVSNNMDASLSMLMQASETRRTRPVCFLIC